MEFKIGDIVSFGGLEGHVQSVDERYDFSVSVMLSSGIEERFTKDGRFYLNHTEPLLKLVSRPKKEVEKTIEVFANVYSDQVCVHSDEDGATQAETVGVLNKTNKKVRIICYTEE